MRNFNRKSTWKSIVESKPVLIILGILILASIWSVLKFWTKMEDASRNKELAAEKVAELADKKADLEADISRLNTEAGKERFFRENYGLAKEGEEMIIVVEEKKVPTAAPQGRFAGFFSFFADWFK